jgi:hypothetical protein
VAGTSAKHLAEGMVARGAQLEVVRDRRNHEAAVQSAAANAFHWPEPLRQGGLEEWASGTTRIVLVWDHGAGLVHNQTLRTESGHTAFWRSVTSRSVPRPGRTLERFSQIIHLNRKGRRYQRPRRWCTQRRRWVPEEPQVFSALERGTTRADLEDSEQSSLSNSLKYGGPLRSLRALW